MWPQVSLPRISAEGGPSPGDGDGDGAGALGSERLSMQEASKAGIRGHCMAEPNLTTGQALARSLGRRGGVGGVAEAGCLGTLLVIASLPL